MSSYWHWQLLLLVLELVAVIKYYKEKKEKILKCWMRVKMCSDHH